jgi:hypothetical protein
VYTKTDAGKPAPIDPCIDWRDWQQLETIFTQIEQMSDAIDIRRISEQIE